MGKEFSSVQVDLRKRFSQSVEYIQSDLYRYNGSLTFKAFCSAYLNNRGFNYCFWLRLAQAELPFITGFSLRVLHGKSRKYGIYIPAEVRLGYGLYIAHGLPVVVNHSATIGNNCNLSQFVTIGSNHGRAAIIGDNVYIGPNVCIVEQVSIGSNAIIGAGSVVVKDVPEGTTAVGAPAKIVGENKYPEYVGNRWCVKLLEDR